MDELIEMDEALDDLEGNISESEEQIRIEARARGRRAAQRMIRKIDPIFAPLRLHADDAKVLCHPVDYVVFKGMNSTPEKLTTGITLIDRQRSDANGRQLQRSIEKTIEREQYEWITLRIAADGSMQQE
jgi:predicted Holliday junction resolvase-like endonuclease